MDISEQNIIPNEHLVKVCKYKQPGCCRYIFFSFGLGEFCCLKRLDDKREGIDEIVKNMKYSNINCEGLPHEEEQEAQGTQGKTSEGTIS